MKTGPRLLGCLAVALLALALGATSRGAETPGAFLDQPMPVPKDVDSFRLLDQVNTIQANATRPVIFPGGFLDFLHRRNPVMDGRRFPFGADAKTITRRGCLDAQCRALDLTWTYDPARDAIVIDFPWHKATPRPAADLLAVVTRRAPRPGDKLPHVPSLNDTWQPAFDEVLSRPENFPIAWKVRTAVIGEPSFGDLGWDFNPISASTLPDPGGSSHILILVTFLPMFSPGPAPRVLYFLFDSAGSWRTAGI